MKLLQKRMQEQRQKPQENKMKSALDLTEEELEEIIEQTGSTSIALIREILGKPFCVEEDGLVDVKKFAQWFGYALEGFIDADEESEEWYEANGNNVLWGIDIAEDINYYINNNAT